MGKRKNESPKVATNLPKHHWENQKQLGWANDDYSSSAEWGNHWAHMEHTHHPLNTEDSSSLFPALKLTHELKAAR